MKIISSIKSFFREKSKDKTRSPHWKKKREEFLKTHSSCAACGSKTLLQVHHKKPFHLDASLELDDDNLITLCAGLSECHLMIGHGDCWTTYNPDVELDAARYYICCSSKNSEQKKKILQEVKEKRRSTLPR